MTQNDNFLSAGYLAAVGLARDRPSREIPLWVADGKLWELLWEH